MPTPTPPVQTLDAAAPDARQCVWVMRYVYDDAGRLLEAQDAVGQASRYRYRGDLLVQETDRNGLSFHFEYDGQGAEAKCLRTWGDGGIYDHKLRYDTVLDITEVEDSLGHSTRYHHAEGIVHRVEDPRGGVTVSRREKARGRTEKPKANR